VIGCVLLIKKSLSDNSGINISFEDSSEDEYSDSEEDDYNMLGDEEEK